MRYLHSDYVRRAATRAAHSLMAPLILKRAENAVRGRVPPALERSAVYYLANVEGRVPMMHLAAALGAPRRYVKQALAAIEDRRDEPAFDRLMDQLASEMFAC